MERNLKLNMLQILYSRAQDLQAFFVVGDEVGCQYAWLLTQFTHVGQCYIRHNSEETLQIALKHYTTKHSACKVT